MPELLSVAGSSGSLGLPSSTPRSTVVSGSGLAGYPPAWHPDQHRRPCSGFSRAARPGQKSPVMAMACASSSLLSWELTFPGAEEEIKQIMIIVVLF